MHPTRPATRHGRRLRDLAARVAAYARATIVALPPFTFDDAEHRAATDQPVTS